MYSKILLLLHLSILAAAQQIVPTSIYSAGQSGQVNGNHISYSLGDYAVLNMSDSSYSLSGTFIGASVITAIEITAPLSGSVTVFPNPSSELVHIEIKDITAKEIHLSIYSADAKEITKQKFNNLNQQLSINISKLPIGIYFLKLRDEKGLSISEHKILKR
jgi:hypothetical protein